MAEEGNLQPYFGMARDLAERVCRQPSVAAQNLGIDAMADLTESLLMDAGFSTRRLTFDHVPPLIFGEQRGRSEFTLLLYNHYDVQPPEPLDLWESPPYEPSIRDGKLYARGISDNKGEIAARLAAIHAIRDRDGELPFGVKWMIEGEEEIGSAHFREIIEPHADLLRADGCLWEGSGFDDKTGRPNLVLGTKGMLYVDLAVECARIDAHSGLAPILPSAAWRLVGALSTLREPDGDIRIPGFADAVIPPTPADITVLEEYESDLEGELRRAYGIDQFVNGLTGLALRERASFSPTCNLAGLSSGYGGEGIKTVLPAKASCKIDFRLVPDQDPKAIAAALRAHLDAEGYTDVRMDILGSCTPIRTPLDDPFVQNIARSVESFQGKQPQVIPLTGGSLPLLEPLRDLVGVPGLSAPTNVGYWGSAAHAPNENVRLVDMDRAVASTVHLFRELCR